MRRYKLSIYLLPKRFMRFLVVLSLWLVLLSVIRFLSLGVNVDDIYTILACALLLSSNFFRRRWKTEAYFDEGLLVERVGFMRKKYRLNGIKKVRVFGSLEKLPWFMRYPETITINVHKAIHISCPRRMFSQGYLFPEKPDEFIEELKSLAPHVTIEEVGH